MACRPPGRSLIALSETGAPKWQCPAQRADLLLDVCHVTQLSRELEAWLVNSLWPGALAPSSSCASPHCEACCRFLEGVPCPSIAQALGTTVDNTGLQRWTLAYVPGSDALYTMVLDCGKDACGDRVMSTSFFCDDHTVDM